MEVKEAEIVINGVKLSFAQSMALRVALTGFLAEMNDPLALGDDEHGRTMVQLYRKNASAVQNLIFLNLNKS